MNDKPILTRDAIFEASERWRNTPLSAPEFAGFDFRGLTLDGADDLCELIEEDLPFREKIVRTLAQQTTAIERTAAAFGAMDDADLARVASAWVRHPAGLDHAVPDMATLEQISTAVSAYCRRRNESIEAMRQSFALPPSMPMEISYPTERSTPQVNNVYNLNGHNARVNQNSVDASTNVVNISNDELFERLREVAAKQFLDAQSTSHAVACVDGLQSATDLRTVGRQYATLVGLFADHIGVITPFLPALAEWIGAFAR